MSQKRILILEDEEAIANTIKHGLEKEGYLTSHFTTIKSAKTGFQQDSFDLLILDVGLPDGSGFDLCRDIRKSSEVPIFFLTARTEEIDRVLGLELGADDYISKPFSPRELLARVKSLFRRVTSTNEISEQTDYGDFKVLEDYFQIFYQGNALKLSRYEFGVLHYLLRSNGRVLSRSQIMEQVWESPEMSLERTIDAHIKSLRKKLKVYSEEEIIVTHRGVGYSI